MLHGEDRELQSHHASHLARPQAAGVHDVLGVHVTALGDHVPRAVRPRLEIDHAVVAHDLGAADLSCLGVGVSHAVGVDVPFDRVEQRSYEVLFIDDREYSRRLVGGDQLELHAKIATACLGHLQPVEALACAGEHDAAGHVQAAGLPGDPLQLLVEIDGVLLQPGDVGIAIEGVHAAGGVPGGSAGELATLDQQHILPAGLHQVIQDAGAHHSAADNHHPRVTLHRL